MRLAILSLALLAVAAPVSVAKAQRLPTGVHPEHYKLSLTPDLKAATFSGTETIDLTLDAPSTTITLNSAEIRIASVAAAGQPATVTYDEPKEQATFTFAQPLSGPVHLDIAYTGILNNQLRGFYLSKTRLRNYAVTQFEATDARRAFPSFDEPALKATFDVSLTVDSGDTVIANGPLLTDTPAGPGKHTLTFGTTPRMSTYLVAFQVGDFKCSSGKADGVPIRVCGTPDKLPYTTFALSATEYILHYYDQYFGIKYPMAKLDLIGLPDFDAGAMENFGCITYRETDLFVDKDASIDAKKRVASVVAHEMAHQWFGDMVTMQWWDNLWLNEGFATWMASKPVNKWHPEWNFPLDDANSLDNTLNLDAQSTTHPILATNTETPGQINELFDGITYGKGGAVIGMVENYLGEETFRKGVHNYLAAHLYANATAEDFWTAQTQTSHQPIDKIMASFVAQPGVPILTFSEITSRAAPVQQSRFFLAGQANAIPQKWTIPVCLTGPRPGHQTCHLLTPSDASIPVTNSLFFANAGYHGYYRTLYSPTELRAITLSAETALTAPERIGLLGDQYALMRSGQGDAGDFLDLVIALKSDPESSVLESSISKAQAIAAVAATPEDQTHLNTLFTREFAPVYASLGQPSRGESYNTQSRRTLLFSLLGNAGDPAVIAQARTLTEDVFAGKKPVDPALTDAAVVVAARNGDVALYEKLQLVAENATDPGLKTDALTTLPRFQQPALVLRTLDYALSPKVRNQDSWILIASLFQQPNSREAAWKYVQQHWAEVSAQFTVTSGARIVAATGNFCTATQRDEVKAFFAAHPVDGSDRTLAKSVDAINDCIRRRAVERPQLESWLAKHP